MDPIETYLRELHTIRASGAAVKETSYYGPLERLLTEIGRTLKPRVRCVIHISGGAAGIPDAGLFTADQFQKASAGAPLPGQLPSRGVVEVKSSAVEVGAIAVGEQVRKYLDRFGQVLVTNYRAFLLVIPGPDGPLALEGYTLARTEAELWSADPAALAAAHGPRLTEYLKRAMLHAAELTNPADVAWFLASYARDARARIEGVDIPALGAIRGALEQALGITFQGERGDHFFRSTLVQTLFYGVFSAWVLWHEEDPERTDRFDWRLASYYLHVPIIQALFEQVSGPTRLRPLGLTEVLSWTGEALNRVARGVFFQKFEQGLAVQYFYEPFLEAFDPVLRKELGVWYTPPEIVSYMVARVDTALREELGIADGLADPNVYVLDPCCGTGAYLVEVLRRIAATLRERGEDALLGSDLKRAATERVFGFELLPAPFVVAHLQLGLLLQNLGAPLADETGERAAIYLTNALTGWTPASAPKTLLLFPELQQESDAAEHIKRDTPILVILGNPPYNGYAGIAIAEERTLSEAYRTTKRAPAPQGQGLNDLYVRFYRMAERRIAEQTGRGVVCFISNYSWLDGLSFTGMRERYLDVFDSITIDSLNGDKYKTGKLTPEGAPDPSVFSTPANPEGIQVGTAIALLVRRDRHQAAEHVSFRNLWGRAKRAQLLETAADGASYQPLTPPLGIGLPFMPAEVAADYLAWPLLPDLFPVSFPGVKTSRDLDLVEIDLRNLELRMQTYFDPALEDSRVQKIAPSLMTSSGGYDAIATRKHLLQRGIETGSFVRFCYRPFDTHHLYWHPETKLLDRKREDLFTMYQAGNLFLTSRQKGERTNEGTPFFITPHLPDWHLTRPGSACFPLTLKGAANEQRSFFDASEPRSSDAVANLSVSAHSYLTSLGVDTRGSDSESTALWMHALATGYSPMYLSENAGALRQDWPRIPLPAGRERLLASAELGRTVATLLDPLAPVAGVTAGAVRPELRAIGAPARVGGGQLNPAADFEVTAGWGHAGSGGVTMPGKGRAVERPYRGDELAAFETGAAALAMPPEQLRAQLGATTYDLYLNDVAYWQNVPARVWSYTIGGYQVLKKWLSYRERPLLGRALTADEARELMQIARRIAAILLLEPRLDASYGAVKEATYAWDGQRDSTMERHSQG